MLLKFWPSMQNTWLMPRLIIFLFFSTSKWLSIAFSNFYINFCNAVVESTKELKKALMLFTSLSSVLYNFYYKFILKFYLRHWYLHDKRILKKQFSYKYWYFKWVVPHIYIARMIQNKYIIWVLIYLPHNYYKFILSFN